MDAPYLCSRCSQDLLGGCTCDQNLPTRLFVYGTLRKGQQNHGLLYDATYLGPAYLPHYEPLPWLNIQEKRGEYVLGEVYENIPRIKTIHSMEVGAGYGTRTVTVVLLPDLKEVEATVYIRDHEQEWWRR